MYMFYLNLQPTKKGILEEPFYCLRKNREKRNLPNMY